MILGQVAGEAVVLARSGCALFAIGAECSHYHGPLAEGVLVAETLRCPWHHACFSLRTGEALRAPALDPVASWRVEEHDGKIYVREKLEPTRRPARVAAHRAPESIVILGGGAAGIPQLVAKLLTKIQALVAIASKRSQGLRASRVNGRSAQVELRHQGFHLPVQAGHLRAQYAMPQSLLLGRVWLAHVQRQQRPLESPPGFATGHQQRAPGTLQQPRDGQKACGISGVELVTVQQ